MEKDFLNYEFQIELNEKCLDKYHSLFETTMSKISLISITYSILAIYTVQFIAHQILPSTEFSIFTLLLAILITLIAISIFFTIKFIIPIKVSHLHNPKYFYIDVKEKYLEKFSGKTIDDKTLNKYIQGTYLSEIQQAVDDNYKAFKTKRRLFYYAFNFSLIAFIPYLACLSIYLGREPQPEVKKVEIINLEKLLKPDSNIRAKFDILDLKPSTYELRPKKQS